MVDGGWCVLVNLDSIGLGVMVEERSVLWMIDGFDSSIWVVI